MLDRTAPPLHLSFHDESPARAAGERLFSVVIPTWNNLPYLAACLDSLERHSAFRHQVVLHVNDGSDGTVAFARQKGYAFTHSPGNIGICHAMNAARALVRTRYIFYLNDDMILLPGWDTALAEAVRETGHDGFFLSSTLIEPHPTRSKPVIAEKDYGGDAAHFDEAGLLRDFRGFEKPDWSGATRPPNLLPVRLWDLVGGFSTEFSPGFYSDPDLSAKLWAAGVREFRGVGASRAYHFVSKTLGRIVPNPGRTQFIRKWGISAADFQKLALRLGEPYAGPLAEPDSARWRRACRKAKLEALFARA